MTMIDVEVNGLEGLMIDMRKASKIPNDVLKEMVTAQADIVQQEITSNATTMLLGPYYEGDVAASVKAKKARVSRTGAYVDITFNGTAHGNRLGEIAFVNEYGKKSQPARPFIKTALTKSRDLAADAAHKVLSDFLSKNGL